MIVAVPNRLVKKIVASTTAVDKLWPSYPEEWRKLPVFRLLIGERSAPENRAYELPIRTPVAKTSAPPRPTWSAAEITGVSINRSRIQVIAASSSTTTTIAAVIAAVKEGSKN